MVDTVFVDSDQKQKAAFELHLKFVRILPVIQAHLYRYSALQCITRRTYLFLINDDHCVVRNLPSVRYHALFSLG